MQGEHRTGFPILPPVFSGHLMKRKMQICIAFGKRKSAGAKTRENNGH
jgi:hypothetical protein